jgi:hypothetical protein
MQTARFFIGRILLGIVRHGGLIKFTGDGPCQCEALASVNSRRPVLVERVAAKEHLKSGSMVHERPAYPWGSSSFRLKVCGSYRLEESK